MRARRATIATLLLAAALAGAGENPVKWTIAEGRRSHDTVTARISAKIDDGWHLYSISQPPGGPIATRIWIPEDQPFKQSGNLRGPKPDKMFDPAFNMDVELYEGSAEFLLPVKPAADGKQTLHVKASYQTCSDTLCLPPKTVALELEIDRKR
jgi:hypothetical protein